MLRKHQTEFDAVIDSIIDGAPIKNILVRATPGGGKSSLPIIAGKLITAGLADKICWICPRMSLQDQAERNFLDPFFREMLQHNLTIRSSTNEINPCRGTNGFVTTYQALGVDKFQTVLSEFKSKRYILVLDEYHHAEADEGAWTEALRPLYEAAAYRVLMTGTLERGDGKKIAFTDYVQRGCSIMPDLQAKSDTAIIEYTRRDALADRGIIPVTFLHSDGRAKWENKQGKIVEAQLSTQDARKAGHALYTALNTEYATELLAESVEHWQRHKRLINRNAKLLVVAAGIEQAKEYTEYLSGSMGLNAEIATSEDSKAAAKAIKRYKAGKVAVLVTVAMAYEGLDVPAITHIACLTNIRSAPWIEQMVARAVRVDPQAGPYETQHAYVFAPDDQQFREIVAKIEADQISPVEIKKSNGKGDRVATQNTEDLFGNPTTPGGITPLSSTLTGRRERSLPVLQYLEEVKTNKEQEADLLKQIERHVSQFCHAGRYDVRKINTQIYVFFGKPRREMTISELKIVLEHCKQQYPLAKPRGTGIPRVPTRAMPIQVAWRQQ